MLLCVLHSFYLTVFNCIALYRTVLDIHTYPRITIYLFTHRYSVCYNTVILIYFVYKPCEIIITLRKIKMNLLALCLPCQSIQSLLTLKK